MNIFRLDNSFWVAAKDGPDGDHFASDGRTAGRGVYLERKRKVNRKAKRERHVKRK